MTALGVLVWYVVAAPSSQVLGPTLWRGDATLPAVALTFDDGPGPDTPQMLSILSDAGVCATFFLCGANVERWPQLARQIVEAGHEIGNHTYSHPPLLGRTPGKIYWEIDRAQKVIEHHTGMPPRLFRPPYGLRWFGLSRILRQSRLTAVMWSVNSRDWKWPADRITERVLQRTHPGAIVLLHDAVPPCAAGDRKSTVEALPAVLRLLGRRYRFVTISELQNQNGG